MEVIICPDEHQVGRVAAERVVSWVQGLATPVLGLATGSSPLALYGELARRVAAGEADFSHGLGFALDEYVGIDPENPLSYRQTIRRTVVEPLRMEPSRVRSPTVPPRPRSRRPRIRPGDQGSRWRRRAGAGHRQQRPHRVQ